MANIRLNILPIRENAFSFKIYRRLKTDEDIKQENIYLYHLPQGDDLKIRSPYLVSFTPIEGFTEFVAHSVHAIGLTKHFLTHLLISNLHAKGCPLQFYLHKSFAVEKVDFILKEFPKGKQIVFLSPYYFEELKHFGFIVDFHFIKNQEVSFDKEVQILSLSLDKNGKSNRNYYADKYDLIQSFLEKVYSTLKEVQIKDGITIHIEDNLLETPVFQLNKKEYIFSNKSTANSQFQGIRNFGPFQKIEPEVLFIFIFEDRFKSFANELYLSLTGKSNPGTFPGLEQMFGLHIGTDNVKQIKIESYTNESLLSIVSQVKAFRENERGKKIIGIYIEDYSTEKTDTEASDHYYFLKYHFIKNSIPLQVVNYRKLSERNSLKWSTSNVALAMFAKMGGIPWIVKPSNNNCLILGVGSSHRRNTETDEITKYFAYTVCLDSSGLYKTLEVLADEETEEHYLERLKTNLINLLRSERFSTYKTCVLHLPFKIKQAEISSIAAAIQEVAEMSFVAIKVNLDNKFFGYSFHNTLVPYESSFVRLSRSEYLVWFEGLLYGKEVVDKRLSNPVHIQFLNIGNVQGFEERKYLQDVLNLSGANWRGFNAKSIPISIYYSQIIAKYTQAFEQIEGYQENAISNDRPWFL
jgi:hypothetical protein